MYILLEPGMKIDFCDECLNEEATDWEPLNQSFIDFQRPYREDHLPMRRKIETVDQLFTAYKP